MTDKQKDLVGLRDFKIPVLKIPTIRSIRNRFGEAISFREFENTSSTLIVLVHGMGGDSRYLTQLGLQISQKTGYQVLLPDLKFHGEMNSEKSVKLSPHQDVVGDLDFLLDSVKIKNNFSNIVLVGHSLGGAVVLKWLLSKPKNYFQQIALIAPYLPTPFNVESENFPLWVVKQGENLRLRFPEQSKWGSEVEEYDVSYIRSCLSDSFDMSVCLEYCSDFSLIVSQADLILDIQKYRNFFQKLPGIKMLEQPGLSHIGLVTSPESGKKIVEFLFP